MFSIWSLPVEGRGVTLHSFRCALTHNKELRSTKGCARFLLFLLSFSVQCEQILYDIFFSSLTFLMKWNRQIFYYNIILHFWAICFLQRVGYSLNTPRGWFASIWFHILGLPFTSDIIFFFALSLSILRMNVIGDWKMYQEMFCLFLCFTVYNTGIICVLLLFETICT